MREFVQEGIVLVEFLAEVFIGGQWVNIVCCDKEKEDAGSFYVS